MARVIAIANQKGGVGKTTTSINLSAALSLLDYRTLLIDADPQANATSGVGVDPKKVKVSIYECLIGKADISEGIMQVDAPNMYLLPSHLDLVGAEIELINQPDREQMMLKALEKVKSYFDFIIIDCSPSLGLITINALTAADSILIPVQCEIFALEGLGKLLNTVSIVQTRLNKKLAIEGILLTMFDTRLRLSKQVVAEVKRHFQGMVFDTIVHRNSRVAEAPNFKKSVIMYDIQSRGAVNYVSLAQEIAQKYGAKGSKAPDGGK